MLLKKKRLEEATIEKIDKHLTTIEQMTTDIEMAQINTDVLQKLQQGSKALQAVNRVRIHRFPIIEVDFSGILDRFVI